MEVGEWMGTFADRLPLLYNVCGGERADVGATPRARSGAAACAAVACFRRISWDLTWHGGMAVGG
jgi:hypothetical protein